MKATPTTVKALCAFIWSLEEKYGLLDYEIDGVKCWQSERMRIYYLLAEKLGIFSTAHARLSPWQKVGHLLKYAGYSIRDNLFTLTKADVVIIPHRRTVRVNGMHIDIYTQYFLDDMQAGTEWLELENAYQGMHKKSRNAQTHYTDWIALAAAVYGRFVRPVLTDADRQLLGSIETEIEATCGVRIDIGTFMKKRIRIFKAQYTLYRMLFKTVAPKTLYLVVSYGKAAAIQAAKEVGAEVIEFQHGVFSPYHLGYSFPNRKTPLEYFPDRFYVWSAYWKALMVLPLPEDDVVIDRFRYLDAQKKKFTDLQKNPMQAVVISQAALGEEIAKTLLEELDRFEGYIIKYKLHPEEYESWQKHPSLVKLSRMANVEIIKEEVPLYALFASSALQIGVFSTALFEGVEFGCKTLLLNLPGVEYMDRFIELHGDVELLQ